MRVETATVGDNYIYVVIDGGQAAALDPSRSAPVMRILEAQGLQLQVVLVTHNHADHTGGCAELESRTGCRVVAPRGSPISGQILVGGTTFDVLPTPGHTRDDIAFYSRNAGVVFTGDTLFVAGCGRVFSGDTGAMWNSLKKLRSLPNDTLVYVGHDYTEENLRFALSLEPDSDALKARLADVHAAIERGAATVPSTIAREKLTNPFLRCDDELFKAAIGLTGTPAAEVFADIRARKDRY